MRVLIAVFVVMSTLSARAGKLEVEQGIGAVQERDAAAKVLQNEAVWLSMVTLLGNPDRYNRKLIRVDGYLHLGEEIDALYLHEEDYRLGLDNGIRLDLSYSERDKYQPYNHKYVHVAGRFYANGPARSTGFGGTITRIFMMDQCQPRQ